MNLLVSFLPILLPFLFLVILKMPAKKGMLFSFIIVLAGAYFVWNMDLNVLAASIIQGVHKAIGILIILFGAIIFVYMAALKTYFSVTMLLIKLESFAFIIFVESSLTKDEKYSG